MGNKNCFIKCSENVIQSGRCDCINNIRNKFSEENRANASIIKDVTVSILETGKVLIGTYVATYNDKMVRDELEPLFFVNIGKDINLPSNYGYMIVDSELNGKVAKMIKL